MGETAKKLTLILGGARSGKSTLAEKLAQIRAGEAGGVLYVATLLPYDAEMRERVALHRASRPASWRTLEAPYKLTEAILANLQGESLVLLDCLTVWTANRLIALMEPGLMVPTEIFEEELPVTPAIEQSVQLPVELPVEPPTTPEQAAAGDKAEKVIDYLALEREMGAELDNLLTGLQEGGVGLVLVSNEVGMGLVPPYPLGRAYRDLLGRLNQRLAGRADEVFFVLAGIPVDLKRLQAELS